MTRFLSILTLCCTFACLATAQQTAINISEAQPLETDTTENNTPKTTKEANLIPKGVTADEKISVFTTCRAHNYRNEKCQLNWEINDASNCDGFAIMRSSDGETWDQVSWVEANAEETTYAFEDLNPIPGHFYYRIQHQALDGESEFSKPISFRFRNETGNLTVFPDAANQELLFDTHGAEIKGEIAIFDSLGDLVYLTQDKESQIDISHLSKGVYILEVKLGQRKVSKKFVVE